MDWRGNQETLSGHYPKNCVGCNGLQSNVHTVKQVSMWIHRGARVRLSMPSYHRARAQPRNSLHRVRTYILCGPAALTSKIKGIVNHDSTRETTFTTPQRTSQQWTPHPLHWRLEAPTRQYPTQYASWTVSSAMPSPSAGVTRHVSCVDSRQ